MKATEFIDIYEMLDRIVNGGDTIKDFGIIDESGEIYATLESGETYSFFIEKGNKAKYINGHRASKADRARLLQDLKNGKNRATAHTTKRGALAIITEF